MKKPRPEKPLGSEELVTAIVSSLRDALAQKIVTIDLHDLHGATDWFILCQGDNTVHNRACADRVIHNLKKLHTRPWQREGLDEGRWILLDYSDVVVHIMLDELREFYNLEGLWSEGVVREIE